MEQVILGSWFRTNEGETVHKFVQAGKIVNANILRTTYTYYYTYFQYLPYTFNDIIRCVQLHVCT